MLSPLKIFTMVSAFMTTSIIGPEFLHNFLVTFGMGTSILTGFFSMPISGMSIISKKFI